MKKLILSQNKRPHNPKTFECNRKKFRPQSESSLLNNCGKISSFSTKKWGSSWSEPSSGIAQICYQ